MPVGAKVETERMILSAAAPTLDSSDEEEAIARPRTMSIMAPRYIRGMVPSVIQP